MKLTVIKREIEPKHVGSHALFPSYNSDVDKLSELREREFVMAEIRRPRNLKHHNKFFAMLRMVVENSDNWSSVDQLLVALKVKLGIFDVVNGVGGGHVISAKSIDFESMDQTEFANNVYAPSRFLLAAEIGCSEDEIENNMEDYL